MPATRKRHFIGRGKAYLTAAGAQARFIVYLLFVLVFYTLLLLVFQKLTAFLPLFAFLPIALIILLTFIGIVGILYSHTFVGPLIRIRRSLEEMAQGETNIALRLREADDPMLKELVKTMSDVCCHQRDLHAKLREAARDLSGDISSLREKIGRGASREEVLQDLERIRRKEDLLQKSIISFGRK